MTGFRDHFSEFTEGEVGVEVILGDDFIVRAEGVGSVSFMRESQTPMTVKGVLYVPGLRKNLISVSAIEDKGYRVVFEDGQVLMSFRGSSITSAKVIGVRLGRLYTFLP